MQQVVQALAASGYQLKTSGIYSTRYLLTLLSDNGHVDTAYRVATQTQAPGWGWWLAQGIDTWPEWWMLESRSRDHHYWASISSWLYQGLAGIRPAAPGYADIIIRPAIPQALEQVSAWLDTVRGRIGSSWQRQPTHLQLDVTIPAGSRAEVWCPGRDASAIAAPQVATWVREEAGYTIYAVPGGEHRFACALAQ